MLRERLRQVCRIFLQRLNYFRDSSSNGAVERDSSGPHDKRFLVAGDSVMRDVAVQQPGDNKAVYVIRL